MAISTQGVKLKISGTAITTPIEVAIKSFPDLGALPAAIEVTTLADEVQKFIPGKKGMAAMEFVANYDAAQFEALVGCEGETLTYALNFGEDVYQFTGSHNALIVGGGLNAAVDMKVVVLPNGEIAKAVVAQ